MTPHMPDLLDGIEGFSDIEDLDYALLAQTVADAACGGDASSDGRGGRKRTFSFLAGELSAGCEEEQLAGAGTAEAADSSDCDMALAAPPAAVENEPVAAADSGRVERKKSREKMRRIEVNERFDELQKLLVTIEPTISAPGAKPAAAKPATAVNRVELLTRAIRVMRRLWADRQASGAGALSHATAAAAPVCTPITPAAPATAAPAVAVAPAPAPLAPATNMSMAMGLAPNMMAMMAAAAAQQQQQNGAKPSNGSGSGSQAPLPMMMLMPMFMPSLAAAAAAQQQQPAAPAAVPTAASVLALKADPHAGQKYGLLAAAAAGARASAPLPQFVAQALSDGGDSTETPTHAVSA